MLLIKIGDKMSKTAENVLAEMKTDLHSYQDFIDEMVVRRLNEHPPLLQSWLDWFNGE